MRRIAFKALAVMILCAPPMGAMAGEVPVVPLPVGIGGPGFGSVISIRTPVDRVIWLTGGSTAEAVSSGAVATTPGQVAGVATIGPVGTSREVMIDRLEAELRRRGSQ